MRLMKGIASLFLVFGVLQLSVEDTRKPPLKSDIYTLKALLDSDVVVIRPLDVEEFDVRLEVSCCLNLSCQKITLSSSEAIAAVKDELGEKGTVPASVAVEKEVDKIVSLPTLVDSVSTHASKTACSHS